ncbi:MAG: glycoside hydrolase [Terracidiphilus sp.]
MTILSRVEIAVFFLGMQLSAATQTTTAIRDGIFHVDVQRVIESSSIVLERPNEDLSEAMPLGNGRLGAAVWSAEGLTAQLNRSDTLPGRLAAGQVVLPGLSALTHAADYAGRLNLYDEEFVESGGGMSATVFVEAQSDTLVIDVKGAHPEQMQTAELRLWKPRTPRAEVAGKIGIFSEDWLDDKNPGGSGRRFGSLATIKAEGRDVTTEVKGPLVIRLSFKPFADGHFRVLVGAPHYDGEQDRAIIARKALGPRPAEEHRSWWRRYWNRTGVIQVKSADGVGNYMANLRDVYLFVAAAERGTEYPGTQAGVADMVSSSRDAHQWDPSAFWHWNLRMQVAANLGAGLPELNDPYFNLYRENLPAIERWTRENMGGRAGICVPETMRFNGAGIEYEGNWQPVSIGRDCDANFKPYYNARTLSTGAEVSLWVWQEYLHTGDRAFLETNYPVMRESARFLLASEKPGPDGLLHTGPTNAHETQWDVTDSTTDLAAEMVLFPVVIEASKRLDRDAELRQQLHEALPRIPPFPRTQLADPRTLLLAGADKDGNDMIAESYLPGAENHNVENIGLEPVWPYDLIGDTSPLFALAQRTFEHRLFQGVADWSSDPIQAARLHLAKDEAVMLAKITQDSQLAPNGLAYWGSSHSEFYVEQVGVVACALEESLAQDSDGLLRIAPSIPPGWDFRGSVFVRGKTKVDVEVSDGKVMGALIEAGATHKVSVENPWPGEAVDVSMEGVKLIDGDRDATFSFQAIGGKRYVVERAKERLRKLAFEPVCAASATSPRQLGKARIGLGKAH